MSQATGTKDKTGIYKLLIAGGGTAGTAVASKFASKLDKHSIAVIEPSKVSARSSIWICFLDTLVSNSSIYSCDLLRGLLLNVLNVSFFIYITHFAMTR